MSCFMVKLCIFLCTFLSLPLEMEYRLRVCVNSCCYLSTRLINREEMSNQSKPMLRRAPARLSRADWRTCITLLSSHSISTYQLFRAYKDKSSFGQNEMMLCLLSLFP